MSVTVRRVVTPSDRKAFIRAWRPALGDDPMMIAPLEFERLEHINPKKNPFFQHAEAAFFLAERDGAVVGRISAQDCELARALHGVGMFGFLDGIDEPDVFAALIAAAEGWLSARGITRVRGPLTLSINDEAGLLVDGFDTPPAMMMGHARPHYGAHLEACGYEKARDLLAYTATMSPEGTPPRLLPFIAKVAMDPAITIRRLRRDRFASDMAAMLDVFNDAWSDNWGFVPFTPAEVKKLSADLKLLLEPDLVWIAEVRGEAVAFVVGLPDVNQAITDLDGKLLPFGLLKLVWRLKAGRISAGRVPLMGVRRRYRGAILGAGLALALIERLISSAAARGLDTAELSWILEDNRDMRGMIEAMGGRAYKTYRVYEKTIA